jgi:hypothetical protein
LAQYVGVKLFVLIENIEHWVSDGDGGSQCVQGERLAGVFSTEELAKQEGGGDQSIKRL